MCSGIVPQHPPTTLTPNSSTNRTIPFVKSAVEKGDLHLHGAYFGVASGRLLIRNEQTGAFEPVGV